jgi:NADH:ubiquinone oxidoreductase subunit 2 (subunit N)
LKILLHPYFVAVVIPIILLLCGAFARKLVRGSTWERKDFYLGVEFTLAALSAALVNFFDLAKQLQQRSPVPELSNQLAATAGFACVTFFILLWVLATHQDWEKQTGRGQFIRLGILSNVVGSGLMCAFVLIVKGV